MRRSGALVLVMVFVVFAPPAGWPCLILLPSDPCADLTEPTNFGSEFISDLPRPDRFVEEGVPEESEEEVVVVAATLEEPDPEPDCGDIEHRLREHDPDRRLTALEEVIDGMIDAEDCPDLVDALRHRAHREKDAFLLYKTIEALAEALDDATELVDFLDHPSVDVRRKAAEGMQGEVFKPEQSERIVVALERETEPWARMAIANLEPEGKEAEVAVILSRMVEDDGPSAASALHLLTSMAGSIDPVLEALDREGALRSAAIDLLGSRVPDPQAREALLRVLQHGSVEEKLHAAVSLTRDQAATEVIAWQSLALDPRVPLRWRAALLLQASLSDPWRPAACQAKRTDPELSTMLDALLADRETDHLLEVMAIPTLAPFELVHFPEGVVRPEAAASVRCASRPAGPPRLGEPRILAGTHVVGIERFTADDGAWLGLDAGSLCWVPADVVDPEANLFDAGAVLEADVPLTTLDGYRTAIAAGDIELFDPVEGFTGIRLRDASREFQARWRSGQEGVLQVLAAVEANALLRERGQAQNR